MLHATSDDIIDIYTEIVTGFIQMCLEWCLQKQSELILTRNRGLIVLSILPL